MVMALSPIDLNISLTEGFKLCDISLHLIKPRGPTKQINLQIEVSVNPISAGVLENQDTLLKIPDQ